MRSLSGSTAGEGSSPRKRRRTTRSAAYPSSYCTNRSRKAARSSAARSLFQAPDRNASMSSCSLVAVAPGVSPGRPDRMSKYTPRDRL